MTVGMLLLIVLVFMLVGTYPAWPHSRDWGYRPSGIIGTLLLILVILATLVLCNLHMIRDLAVI